MNTPDCACVRNGVRLMPAEETTVAMLSATDARANLYRLIDEAAESHAPVTIAGKRHSAVLVSLEDWNAIQETLHLLSIPGMRESIKEGQQEAIDSCANEVDW